MALRTLEILVSVLLLIVLITQVIVPIARGRLCFPIFRRQGQLESQLNELRQQQDEEDLEKQIEKLKPKPTKSRKGTKENGSKQQ